MLLKERENKIRQTIKKSKWVVFLFFLHIARIAKKIFNSKKKIALVVIFIIYTLSVSIASVKLYRDLFYSGKANIIKSKITALYNTPFDYFKNVFDSNQETIYIDIKFKNWQKIMQKRDEALSKGLLINSDNDYIPAGIRYKNKKIPIKIRLKGDCVDHFTGNKWSFRIKTSGDNTLFGMKRFSLQDPERRNFIFSWIFHKILEKEGLISLKYDFVNVVLNGESLGVYNIEEHFSEQLIARNNRPNGPILKFNEDIYFAAIEQERPDICVPSDPRGEIYIANKIEPFEPNKVLNDPVLEKQFQTAKNLLESFRRGILPAEKVFDTKKFAKFYALIDLLGGNHGEPWTNLRLYYNPVTSMLEPIGYDAYDGYHETKITYLTGFPKAENEAGSVMDFRYAFFKNESFFKEYIKKLEKFSNIEYIDSILSELNKELKIKLSMIRKDKHEYVFNKNDIYANQRFIKNALNPIPGIIVYTKKEDKQKIILEIGNAQPLSIEIKQLSYDGKTISQTIDNKIITGKISDKPIEFYDLQFNLPADFNIETADFSKLKIDYSILGSSFTQSAAITPWTLLDIEKISNDTLRKPANFQQFGFLKINYRDKIISAKQGWWNLNKDLLIPSGWLFAAGDGTTINLINSARIISYSPLNFIGSEENPVRITSSDKTGKGIVILNANKESIFKNAVFDNLRSKSDDGWNLRASVTFYESPVNMDNVKFLSLNSEDALGIIRSDFKISNSFFKNSLSDAIDVDFGKGTIFNTILENSGNDALDFSGSYAEINNVDIKNAGDKGVSGGEKSVIKGDEITVSNAKIAIASKDLSEVFINKITVKDSQIGFAVFQKKPEFGPGWMSVIYPTITNVKQRFFVEKGSTLEVKHQSIKGKELNVKEKLYDK